MEEPSIKKDSSNQPDSHQDSKKLKQEKPIEKQGGSQNSKKNSVSGNAIEKRNPVDSQMPKIVKEEDIQIIEKVDEPVRMQAPTQEVKELTISERCTHAKASVVACLLERFQEHVGIYTKREMEQDLCFQFLQLLLKAKTPDDFMISWQCQDPDSRISLSMDQFRDLKGEALYWYDISKIFYEDDIWNY